MVAGIELDADEPTSVFSRGETGGAGILPFELQDLAVGDGAEFVEDGDVAASSECRLGAGIGSQVPIEQPVSQLRQRIWRFSPPLNAPMRMQRIFSIDRSIARRP